VTILLIILLTALWAGAGLWLTLESRRTRQQAARILEEAGRKAAAIREHTLLEVREELALRRTGWEGEAKAIRTAATEREQRLSRLLAHAEQRQESLAEREQALEAGQRELDQRGDALRALDAEARQLRESQKHALLSQAALGQEEAQQAYLRQLEATVQHEAGIRWDREVKQVEEDAEPRAREILHTVLHRIRTRSTLDPQHHIVLPKPETVARWFVTSPEIKAKLEELTGVEITREPEGEVRFNAYDGVWREVAKLVMQESERRPGLTVETLPALVQEQEAILTKSLAKIARRFFERMRLRDIHPDVVQAMGRLRFRTSYGQNILEHSVEAGYIASLLAAEVGLSSRLAMRCGLLHDLGKALTTADGGLHDDLGAELATRCGEPEAVIGAIDGHHGANNNPYTKLAMAGDAISGARPGARRETYEKYVERINQLHAIASGFPEVQGVDLMKAGREVRVQVPPHGLTDEEVTALAGQIAERIEQGVIYPGEIHVTAIKEMKVVEYAR
jgi:ribonuclease Y